MKESKIIYLNDTDLRRGLNVYKSEIHGLGLFAVQDFLMHDVIWNEKMQKDKDPEQDGPLRWTNHSDDPNSLLVLNTGEMLDMSLVATRPISEGEEITYNYNLFGHSGIQAYCNCGKSNCKGYFLMRSEWGERK